MWKAKQGSTGLFFPELAEKVKADMPGDVQSALGITEGSPRRPFYTRLQLCSTSSTACDGLDRFWSRGGLEFIPAREEPIALDLSRNSFVGMLPNEVGNLRNLGYLDVSENQFSCDIPVTLGTCIRLKQLYMGGNKLQGVIPQSLGSL
ncbi:hypothetical protein CRG98_032599 [Punica granatum]|uniref:Uncharacterized protein n=1 Tax=Punica granatum TaxID=22663 RepID=A0A2I0ISK9_PUNGR|nr:hypothetical protein CRG98_032599 [Punica granatum]